MSNKRKGNGCILNNLIIISLIFCRQWFSASASTSSSSIVPFFKTSTRFNGQYISLNITSDGHKTNDPYYQLSRERRKQLRQRQRQQRRLHPQHQQQQTQTQPQPRKPYKPLEYQLTIPSRISAEVRFKRYDHGDKPILKFFDRKKLISDAINSMLRSANLNQKQQEEEPDQQQTQEGSIIDNNVDNSSNNDSTTAANISSSSNNDIDNSKNKKNQQKNLLFKNEDNNNNINSDDERPSILSQNPMIVSIIDYVRNEILGIQFDSINVSYEPSSKISIEGTLSNLFYNLLLKLYKPYFLSPSLSWICTYDIILTFIIGGLIALFDGSSTIGIMVASIWGKLTQRSLHRFLLTSLIKQSDDDDNYCYVNRNNNQQSEVSILIFYEYIVMMWPIILSILFNQLVWSSSGVSDS